MNKFYFSALFLAMSALGFAQQQAYYNEIDFDLNGVPLKEELATLITNTHTKNLSYNQVWGALKNTDLDPEDNANVLLLYGWDTNTSGSENTARRRNKDSNGGGTGEWNREHTYAKSLGTPDLGESGPGADAHHLRASDVSRNGMRGNRKFAAGSGNSGNAGAYWYPGDEWKGDVARMMMYMYVRYKTRCLPNNVGVGSTESTPDGMIDLFLQWNAEDPVSEVEIQRNEYLSKASNTYGQGNRNPFIDNPYLATKIWGGPAAEDRWGTVSIPSNAKVLFALFPNPGKENRITIQSEATIEEITVFTTEGKTIKTIKHPEFTRNLFEITSLKNGFYFVTLKDIHANVSTKKFIIK